MHSTYTDFEVALEAGDEAGLFSGRLLLHQTERGRLLPRADGTLLSPGPLLPVKRTRTRPHKYSAQQSNRTNS